MKVAIIDYGAGNLQSVYNALKSLNFTNQIFISNSLAELEQATHLIVPGVGAFADCMSGLHQVEGLIKALRKHAIIERKPLLGICVGMQVFATIGHENGENKGLDFIEGQVIEIDRNLGLKVPHMGWNELVINEECRNHPILESIKNGDHVYFANSYHFICKNNKNILAQVEYGTKMNALIAQENIMGIQFHPEKSGETGLRILQNFLNYHGNKSSSISIDN